MAETNSTKQLDSIIQIDGTEYEVIAKTAEKVAASLTIRDAIEESTYNGSEAAVVDLKDLKINSISYSNSAAETIQLYKNTFNLNRGKYIAYILQII
jgi:hypothetical protein